MERMGPDHDRPAESMVGHFDDEPCRLEPIENPLDRECDHSARNELSPMCPERTLMSWLAALDDFRNWLIREAA